MTRALTLDEAADQLRVSRRWLEYWLADHPVDAAGVPFYYRVGRRRLFETSDIQRIRDFLREKEKTRLRPRPPVTGRSNISTELLAELAVSSVLGPSAIRRTRAPKRRVRLPRSKPKPEG